MHARWFALSTFVALSGAAFAQSPAPADKAAEAPPKISPSPAVLGKNDTAFATALKRAGFTDLAERLLKTIESSGKASPEEAIGLRLVTGRDRLLKVPAELVVLFVCENRARCVWARRGRRFGFLAPDPENSNRHDRGQPSV